ncbi:NAA20 acetyltransferase, partial [Psophia crepitans]|nr:NAA20 acetyltransferase [Psophia crepitans]
VRSKAEGAVAAREEWHGRVTALSVAPEFPWLGSATERMELPKDISEKGGFFIHLFVGVSNQVGVNTCKQRGDGVCRTALEHCSASSRGEREEAACDTRKALSRDAEKKSVVPLPHPVREE